MNNNQIFYQYQQQEKQRQINDRHTKRIVIGVIIGIAIFFILLIYFFSNITSSRMDGDTMQPTIQNAQRVWIHRHQDIHHSSIIAFDAHGEDPQANFSKYYYVKRVIGLPGDTIAYKNGNIYVNGEAIQQKYADKLQRGDGTGITGYQNNGNWNLKQLSKHWKKNKNITKVPKNCYFVLGDHRSISSDSRYWGFVQKSHIIGVVDK